MRRNGTAQGARMLQQLANGLLIGGLYALVAGGLTLALGVLRVMNMAHGVTISIAAIAGIQVARLGAPFPVILLAGAVVGAIVGIGTELIAFRPLRNSRRHDEESREFSSLLASLALLFAMEAAAQNYSHHVSDDEVLAFPVGTFSHTVLTVGSIGVRSIAVLMLGVALVATLGGWWIIRRTPAGRAARALAADHETASMLGIRVGLYAFGVMAVAGALAGLAGILVGVAFSSVTHLTGAAYLLRAFAVVILGGIGSIPGALVGGLILGVAEGLTVHLIGSEWIDATAFGLLFLILIVRPQGLFGEVEVDRA